MTLQKKAASICLFLLVSACAFAQTVTGSLVGTVVDPAGSVVPGAPIQLTNQGTAAVLTATTDSEGLFRFPNLTPATYTVTVQATGFKTRVERDITSASVRIAMSGVWHSKSVMSPIRSP